MRRTLWGAFFFLLVGLAAVEAGILSIIVSVAYARVPGGFLPAAVGFPLVIAGGYFLVVALRKLTQKKEKKGSSIYAN
ncbi:MAG: hypothetical protein LBO66_12530 [Deltaproteobacteria bacterium]|jgi:hypothetical protein|nr:hypothetical protein [Deltaproteobacteria bacterium]